MKNPIAKSGLRAHTAYWAKAYIQWPLITHPMWRSSELNKHRCEARRRFSTSKDVMPAMAGYTSPPREDGQFFLWGNRNLEIVTEQGYQNLKLDNVRRS